MPCGTVSRAGLKRLLPATEMLYIELAKLEVARGRPEAVAGIRREWLAKVGDDGWTDVPPSDAWTTLGATALGIGAG